MLTYSTCSLPSSQYLCPSVSKFMSLCLNIYIYLLHNVRNCYTCRTKIQVRHRYDFVLIQNFPPCHLQQTRATIATTITLHMTFWKNSQQLESEVGLVETVQRTITKTEGDKNNNTYCCFIHVANIQQEVRNIL